MWYTVGGHGPPNINSQMRLDLMPLSNCSFVSTPWTLTQLIAQKLQWRHEHNRARIFDICLIKKGNWQVPLNEEVERVRCDMELEHRNPIWWMLAGEALSSIRGVRSARFDFQVPVSRGRLEYLWTTQSLSIWHAWDLSWIFGEKRSSWMGSYSFEFCEYPLSKCRSGFVLQILHPIIRFVTAPMRE